MKEKGWLLTFSEAINQHFQPFRKRHDFFEGEILSSLLCRLKARWSHLSLKDLVDLCTFEIRGKTQRLINFQSDVLCVINLFVRLALLYLYLCVNHLRSSFLTSYYSSGRLWLMVKQTSPWLTKLTQFPRTNGVLCQYCTVWERELRKWPQRHHGGLFCFARYQLRNQMFKPTPKNTTGFICLSPTLRGYW